MHAGVLDCLVGTVTRFIYANWNWVVIYPLRYKWTLQLGEREFGPNYEAGAVSGIPL